MPDTGKKVPPSRHLIWYREIVPATIPVILLGTGIFFTLTLLQTHLSHSRTLDDSSARISALEDELRELRESQKRQAVNWSAGLGTVVRRVRDLGREVHADHATNPSATPSLSPASAPAVTTTARDPEPARGIADRIISTFGNPFSRQPTQEIKQSLVHTEEKIEQVVTPLAIAAGEKMDQIRDTATTKASELSDQVSQRAAAASDEFAHRVETLPERADPTTANPSLATRLLATFGNPRKDDIKAQQDLETVKSSAEQLTHDAAEAVNAAKERIENVDLQDIKQSLLRTEEKVEQAVTPLATATAEKMDTLREKATLKAEEITDEWSRRVETLPERADPTTANPSLATQLLATFGNPRKDDVKAQRDLETVKASAGELASEAAEAVHAAKERIENVDLEEIKQSLLRTEEKVEQAVTPLAIATAEKMDTLREKATLKAEEITDEWSRRVETLPERADPATANPSLATRLLATFGNPRKDDVKAQRDLETVKASAEEFANEAAEAVNAAKERLEHVDLQEVKQSLLRTEEKVEQAVTPIAIATAEKMDHLRETATARASDLAANVDSHLTSTTETINARLAALPPRGVDNPAQGIDPVLASRIVATFGNPADEARITRREVGDAVGMGNVARVEEGVAAAKSGVAVAKDVVGEVVGKVERSVDEGRGKGWWRS